MKMCEELKHDINEINDEFMKKYEYHQNKGLVNGFGIPKSKDYIKLWGGIDDTKWFCWAVKDLLPREEVTWEDIAYFWEKVILNIQAIENYSDVKISDMIPETEPYLRYKKALRALSHEVYRMKELYEKLETIKRENKNKESGIEAEDLMNELFPQKKKKGGKNNG